MSAICGVYAKKTRHDPFRAMAMMEEYRRFPFNASHYWKDNSVFLSAHLNYITPGPFHEEIPIKDQGLVITADAIIDNRRELSDMLDIPAGQRSISDGRLILLAYKAWGPACSERLTGDFAFAIWDITKNELFCSRDHVGKRCLYYYDSENIFAFSSLIRPLFQLNEIKKAPNEIFIADFLKNSNVLHNLDPESTIYKDIFQLPAGHSLLVSGGSLKVFQYWSPFSLNTNAGPMDKESFLEVFKEAVDCRTTGTGKIGVMLSGGLDSGSIAAIAAKKMKEQNRKLYAFTHIPIDAYESDLPENEIADETPLVLALCGKFPNIITSFVKSEGKDPFSIINTMIDVLEYPYKPFQNHHWLCDITQKAKASGINVLLDGQVGNATISWGDYHTSYLGFLLRRWKLIKFLREAGELAKIKKKSRIKLILHPFYALIKDSFRKPGNRPAHRELDILSFINPGFYEKVKYDKGLISPFDSPDYSSEDDRIRILGLNTLGFLGAFETKLSIFYGLTKRDPTRDKRVLEFCMAVPAEEYIKDGVDRRLVRIGMEGILPDIIRLNRKTGRQSEDWTHRIKGKWNDIRLEIQQIGQYEIERNYLDIKKLHKTLEQIKSPDIMKRQNKEMVLLMRALIFARFIRKSFT